MLFSLSRVSFWSGGRSLASGSIVQVRFSEFAQRRVDLHLAVELLFLVRAGLPFWPSRCLASIAWMRATRSAVPAGVAGSGIWRRCSCSYRPARSSASGSGGRSASAASQLRLKVARCTHGWRPLRSGACRRRRRVRSPSMQLEDDRELHGAVDGAQHVSVQLRRLELDAEYLNLRHAAAGRAG